MRRLVHDGGRSESVELMEALRRNFETVAMAKVSTSAVEARRLGSAVARRRHHHESRAPAERRQGDWRAKSPRRDTPPPLPRTDIPAPGENLLATLKLGVHMMRQGEFISDHDVKVANWVAYVLCGGASHPRHAGQRAVSAGSGAGSVPLAVRRKENPGADRLHVEDRQAAAGIKKRIAGTDEHGLQHGRTQREVSKAFAYPVFICDSSVADFVSVFGL